MKWAILTISSANIYSESSVFCTSIGQVLFGDLVQIIGSQKNFYHIIHERVSTPGYILKSQVTPISLKEYKYIRNSAVYYSTDSVSTIILNDRPHLLSIGSTLYNFDGLVCDVLGKKISYGGNAILSTQKLQQNQLENILKKIINTPYHTGGCSKFGIDSLGLLQYFCKWNHLPIPTTIQQVYEMPNRVGLVKNAQYGDVIFYGSKEVEHIGIVLNSEQILHCSGCVLVSKYDYLGIKSQDLKSYDYQKVLKIIRLFP